MISFNKPCLTGSEKDFILAVLKSNHISGDGSFTKKCNEWFEKELNCKKALLTTSCTHALEIAAMLIHIKPGDEVIMSSYTFVSTANAFVLRGAKIVFVDIRPDTMNINENLIESAITNKTRAIVPVHYAGVACEMDTIMSIAKKYNLIVIEDAAQGMMSEYKGRKLGTIGHLATYSFHETKNYTSGGEGGLIILNDKSFVDRAEIIREKGTNRKQFFRGEVDKYSWVDIGSSYLPNEFSAAYLWGQLQHTLKINKNRLNTWNIYNTGLNELKQRGLIETPVIPIECSHNAQTYYIKVKNIELRSKLIAYLKNKSINTVFHYVPLHSSKAGNAFSRFNASDVYTTIESERLMRLPLYYNIKTEDVLTVISAIITFFK